MRLSAGEFGSVQVRLDLVGCGWVREGAGGCG